MNFVDISFFIFAIVFFAPYFYLQGKVRILWILAGSYFFYAWFSPVFCLLLAASSLIDYLLAQKIFSSPKLSAKKKWLILSLLVNLGVLIVFKYRAYLWNDCLLPSFGLVGYPIHPLEKFLAPVGISFFTFQTMSYTIDVYRGLIRPAKSFLNFFAYVSLFPQLVAGPIVRASVLLPQLDDLKQPSLNQVKEGAKRFARGFIKKACIADSLALLFVDSVYSNPLAHSPEFVLLAVLAYSFQIYFDFSGYSDMAIGLGNILGFKFPENFNRPYLAKSFSDFWRRWHISLSTWLKDYLYIPLGGNRRGSASLNLIITMLLGGLWHGASSMFILWGLGHGLLLVLQRFARASLPQSIQSKVPDFLKVGFCFIVVTLLWVPFRSSDMSTAKLIFNSLAQVNYLSLPTYLSHLPWSPSLLLGICFLSHFFRARAQTFTSFNTWPLVLKVPLVASVLFWCFHYFPDSANQPFIYFQF